MDFELIGEISDIETIAVNLSIRERDSLKASYEVVGGESSRVWV